jgi:SUKH-3 immunity protein
MKAKAFLQEFSGLAFIGEKTFLGVTTSKTNFIFDGNFVLNPVDDASLISRYDNFRSECGPICWVGSISDSYLYLIMDERGAIFAFAYDIPEGKYNDAWKSDRRFPNNDICDWLYLVG